MGPVTFIDSGELASLRTDLEQSLPGTAVIETKQGSSNAGGGATATWVPTGTVPCRLSPLIRQGLEDEVANRLQPESRWTITVPALTDVDEKDRFLIAGEVYNVTRVKGFMDYEVSRRVETFKEF